MSSSVKRFEAVLEHDVDEQYLYEPGELMTGKVILEVEDSIRVKAVLVQVKGEATVSWQNEEKSGDTFSTDEIYLDKTFPVFGSDEDGVQSTEVTKGEHAYFFEYLLPRSLPSSFIGKYGSVTYIIKATLKEDRPGELGTTITTEPFLLLKPLDLASRPDLHEPRTVVASRRTSGFSLFCCLFGKTVGRFRVNKTGFLPGDDMLVDAEISNDASQPVKSIQAALVLVCQFQAKKLTRTHTQVVLKKTDNAEVDFEEKRKWSGVRLSVPAYVPESNLEGCDMISIAYELRFRLEMTDGSDVTAAIPITIGTARRKSGGAGAGAGAGAAAPGSKGSVRAAGNGSLSKRGGIAAGNGHDDGNDGGGGGDMEGDLEKFRHPMIPGETRKNMLYDGSAD